MNTHPPVVVHRAGIGLLVIYTIGILGFGLAALIFDLLFTQYDVPIYQVTGLLILAIALDLALVYLSVYVYTRSAFIFAPQQLTVITQVGLFRPQSTDCPMTDVQDVKVVRTGFLSSVFNYGTLVIQVANDTGMLSLPTIPDPDHWASYLLQAHEAATTSTTP